MDVMDLRIAPDGEILAKSDVALDRYWGEDSGAALFDHDGYLRTGDLGELRDGYLYITGRKKEIIKTSTGQRIAPRNIEFHYGQVRGVEQIMVVGNKRKYLSALVELEDDFAATLQDEGKDVHSYLQAEFESRESALAPNRRIQGFAVLPRSLSIEAGELTPTMKLRRHCIEQRYAGLIESIYAQGGAR